MTKKEIVKCLYDYATCGDHQCGDCSAYQNIKFENGELHNTCVLLNILEYGELVNEEDKK